MNENDKLSRVNKYEKRRKITKSITILAVIASVLVIALLGMWIFGDRTPSTSKQENPPQNQNTGDTNTETNDNDDHNNTEDDGDAVVEDDDTDTEEEDGLGSNQTDVEKQPVESTDSNVVEAYTADWQPIGTEQTGPHTTQFKKGTQDWQEMERAIQVATGLTADNMTTHFIGNGGEPNKVIGTVSSKDNTQIYRVFLTWVDEQGWQPTKVEVLRTLE